MLSRIHFVGVVSLGILSLAGCSNEGTSIEAESTASDLTGHVKGSTIASPNAKPSATYLSARSIDRLGDVGALPGTMGTLAYRVDGIIANQPADGRISIQELLQIEKPGFIETLFPDEKAALPALWSLLETTNMAPAGTAASAPAGVTSTDVSVPAGAPVEPASLLVGSLPTELQLPSQRLELTHDSDANALTVTKADLNAAIATPGPYTPADIASFQKVLAIFTARAGTALDARVEVVAPFSKSATIATFGAASLTLDESLAYTETRNCWLTGGGGGAGSVGVDIRAHHVWQANLALGGDQKAIIIDETAETERVVSSGALEVATAGPATVEIWSNGTRIGSWRADLPAIKHVDDSVDLSKFADYSFFAGGAPLVRNVAGATTQTSSWWNRWTGSEHSTTYNASYTYDAAAKAPTSAVDAAAVNATATPALPIAAGRYEVSTGASGVVDIDIYPSGLVRITRVTGGASMRASLYRWDPTTKWDADFADRFRVILEPSGHLSIFFDGQGTLFDASIATAVRKG